MIVVSMFKSPSEHKPLKKLCIHVLPRYGGAISQCEVKALKLVLNPDTQPRRGRYKSGALQTIVITTCMAKQPGMRA